MTGNEPFEVGQGLWGESRTRNREERAARPDNPGWVVGVWLCVVGCVGCLVKTPIPENFKQKKQPWSNARVGVRYNGGGVPRPGRGGVLQQSDRRG